jgi:formamidopyrimidine-DNA glycosylase
VRKLGLIDWLETPEDFITGKELGDDPLGERFDCSRFEELLEGRRGFIKSLLMNQTVIAGIGNIYSDEILFQAGIHPKTRVNHLSSEEIEKLYGELVQVIDTAIQAKADPADMPSHFLLPVRREQDKCPKCGGDIASEKVSGRNAYFCLDHQHLK